MAAVAFYADDESPEGNQIRAGADDACDLSRVRDSSAFAAFRDEAAALLPLAEATVSDSVPLADGPPKILQDARGRRDAEDYPAYMLPPEAPEPRHSDGEHKSGEAVLPGSAVARLLELATLGPADDFDAAKKPRVIKAPATRAATARPSTPPPGASTRRIPRPARGGGLRWQ